MSCYSTLHTGHRERSLPGVLLLTSLTDLRGAIQLFKQLPVIRRRAGYNQRAQPVWEQPCFVTLCCGNNAGKYVYYHTNYYVALELGSITCLA